MSSVCSHVWPSGFHVGWSPWLHRAQLESVKSHFPWVQWHFPGWRMGRWGQRRVTGNACLRSGGAGPSSTLWRIGNPWKVKRELLLILFVDLIVCFPFSCWDNISYSPGWPWTSHPLPFTSWAWELKVCITMPRLLWDTYDQIQGLVL